jgi:YD repeat-containing protein
MGMQLEATLAGLGAAALVVGHTPQMGGLNAECDGRVWRVDAGMSSGVLNAEPQVLEFARDEEGRLVARTLQAGGAAGRAFVYAAAPAARRPAAGGAVAA